MSRYAVEARMRRVEGLSCQEPGMSEDVGLERVVVRCRRRPEPYGAVDSAANASADRVVLNGHSITAVALASS